MRPMLVSGEQSVSTGILGQFSMSMLPIYDDGNSNEKYGRPSTGNFRMEISSGPNVSPWTSLATRHRVFLAKRQKKACTISLIDVMTPLTSGLASTSCFSFCTYSGGIKNMVVLRLS